MPLSPERKEQSLRKVSYSVLLMRLSSPPESSQGTHDESIGTLAENYRISPVLHTKSGGFSGFRSDISERFSATRWMRHGGPWSSLLRVQGLLFLCPKNMCPGCTRSQPVG